MAEHRKTEMEFHKEMVKLYHRHVDELGRRPSRFIQGVMREGGLAYAKRLLGKAGLSAGFEAAAKRRRPDLTVEYVIVEGGYQHLFGPFEILTAKQRLDRIVASEKVGVRSTTTKESKCEFRRFTATRMTSRSTTSAPTADPVA